MVHDHQMSIPHAGHAQDPIGIHDPNCPDCGHTDSPGRLGKAARVWAEKRRSVDYEAAVLVELAIDAADMADRAREDKEDRLYLAAATRLQQLMRQALHDDDSGNGSDPWSAEVAKVLGAGPGMGNTPQS